MKVIGIDPSMRSTGICVMDGDDVRYHLICSSPTKKLLNLRLPFLTVHQYEAEAVEGTAIEKETTKMNNIYKVISALREILELERPDRVIIEAVAMMAATHGRLDQLSYLNGIIRYVCYLMGIPCYAIISTSNKLQFSGMGNAKKEDMVRCWKLADPRMNNLSGYKLDDLADAYALACFPI